MQIEAVVGLCIALAFGTWAYIDVDTVAEASAAGSRWWRGFDVATVALIVVILSAVSMYFLAHVPVLLWEMTAGLLLGSLSLRLLFHVG
jgi:hypothetical protein